MSREIKNQVSKEKILKAALAEFGENEYFKASTNSLCKREGISKGLLFHYFKNKDELYLYCVKKTLDELVDYIKSNYSRKHKDLEGNLNEYFKIREDFFNTHLEYNNIFKSITFSFPKHLKEEIRVLKGGLRELNKSILIDLLDDLPLRDDVSQNSLIELIFSFTDYMLVEEYDENKENYNLNFITFINMVLYGVVKREGK